MKPSQQYQRDLEKAYIQHDKEQARALQALDRLQQSLEQQWQSEQGLGRFKQWLPGGQRKAQLGVYLWGGVGIGKTYLMDIFFDSLTFPDKKRLHFHRFMHEVHEQLKQHQGQVDPLVLIAKNFAKDCRVLCFDEFFVNDITDAMLLAGLFKALFECGVSLVGTSNVAPDDLYRNGLQRARFLPAIELLKQHTEVLHLETSTDYRLKTLSKAGVYFTPLNADSDAKMQACFQDLTHHINELDTHLLIHDREVPVRGLGSDVIWFDFDVLCSVPRSQDDYLDIASQYQTLLLSGLDQIAEGADDKATYLIHLIDVMYDYQVKIIIASEVPIEAIYPKGRLRFAFERTQSRLQEMQSTEYLHRPHRSEL